MVEPGLDRRHYRERLLDEWAKLDPDAMLEWLETADLTDMVVSTASFRALATSRPQELLALTEQFAPFQRVLAQRAAVDALAALDPMAAFEQVSALRANIDRNSLITRIAAGYVNDDPEGALAWATSLDPRSMPALNAVLMRIATTDPIRAVDVAIAEILDPVAANRGETPSILSLLTAAMQSRSAEVATIADKLAAHGDPRVRAELETMLNLWPRRDPEASLDWAMRNTASLTPSSVGNFAVMLGQQNPALARATVSRLPANLQGQWVIGAARGMGQTDLDGALAWIDDFRDTPSYGAARESALDAAARTQPGQVARIIDNDPAAQARLAPTIAGAWAARDPVAAERWVLAMPGGATRDQGLGSLVQQAASRGAVDAGLLDAFSSDDARARALVSSMRMLARSDPELGRQLIDTHIADPDMRAQAASLLESGGLPSGLPPGVVIFQ